MKWKFWKKKKKWKVDFTPEFLRDFAELEEEEQEEVIEAIEEIQKDPYKGTKT